MCAGPHESDEIRIAYIRLLLADRDGCEQALTTLKNALPQEIRGDRTVRIDYETEYHSGSFDMGLGIEIAEKLPSSTGMVTVDGHTLPISEKNIRFPNETACLICELDEYDQAILALHQHLEEHHCQITGPTYQIVYEDGITEIKVPICQLSATPQDPRNDDIRVPFENDESVIGRWELIDVLPSREQFLPGYPKLQPGSPNPAFPYDALFWRTAQFLPEGEMRNTFRSISDMKPYTDDSEVWRWVTGNVICNPRSTASMYRFQEYHGVEYLLIQWKSGDYTYGGEEPYWYVFQREMASQ